MTEETLFELALNTPAADRSALLARECADNLALLSRIAALLAAHEQLERISGEGLSPASATIGETTAPESGESASERAAPSADAITIAPTPGATADGRPAEAAGAVLAGRYKLVEEIGEGGMGSVWMAQQTEPVRRVVAVKIIKAGMDSKAVLARFEAERQALAMMDHPNIARVLDAGTTEGGRPFFVMELVKGVPITRFCDERRLSPRQRLELFVPVCQAIQHAHQKGVIHRDIKPSNVLVALYDDRPVPKVIDFGVAKATGPALTEHTLLTGFGTVVGTPEYMSPEQATLNNLDIDTRSDVYALGVLLYELLTGTTPVDRRRLGQAAVLEILRIVREVEPPTPSSRLSTLEALPSIAANRSVEPARLTRMLRGELDWIAMKALDKDRSRRYETANALARDVQRYLADEVVEARPPSAGYRLRKFVRRHKGRVMAASLVLLALVAGIIGTTWGLVRAKAANAQAQKRLEQIEKGNELLAGIFANLDIDEVKAGDKPLEAVLADRLVKAAEQLEGESVGDPLVVAALQEQLGISLESLGFAPQAIPVLEKARATWEDRLGRDHAQTLAAMNDLARGYLAVGKLDSALPLFEETLRLSQARLGPDHPETLRVRGNLARGYLAVGKLDSALPFHEETLRLMRARLGPDHPNTLAAMNDLATGYQAAGQLDRALPRFEETLRLTRAKLGPDHPETLTVMSNLALDCFLVGQTDRALPLFEETLRLRRAKLGPDHPRTLTAMSHLAAGYALAGRSAEAAALMKELVANARKSLPKDSRQLAGVLAQHGATLLRSRVFAGAESLLRECLAIREKSEPDAWTTFNTRSQLGGALLGQKKYTEAEPLLLRGYEGMKAREKSIPPPAVTRLPEALDRLIELYTATNRPDEVKKWQAERARYDKGAASKPDEKK
jgi:tetratricopeptide (TPR) repeat protein